MSTYRLDTFLFGFRSIPDGVWHVFTTFVISHLRFVSPVLVKNIGSEGSRAPSLGDCPGSVSTAALDPLFKCWICLGDPSCSFSMRSFLCCALFMPRQGPWKAMNWGCVGNEWVFGIPGKAGGVAYTYIYIYVYTHRVCMILRPLTLCCSIPNGRAV